MIGDSDMSCSTRNAQILSIEGNEASSLFDTAMDLEPVEGIGGTTVAWRDNVTNLQFESELAQHSEGFSGRILRVKSEQRLLCEIFLRQSTFGFSAYDLTKYAVEYPQYLKSLKNLLQWEGENRPSLEFGEEELFQLALQGARACHRRFLRYETDSTGKCRIVVTDTAKSVDFDVTF